MSLDTVLLVAGVVFNRAGDYCARRHTWRNRLVIADSRVLFSSLAAAGMRFALLAALLRCLRQFARCLFWFIPSSSSWNPFVLREKQKNSEGYTGAADYSCYLGKKGKVIAPLRPAGTALIDGERVDVVSFGDYIDKDSEIEVVKIEGSKLLVKKYE